MDEELGTRLISMVTLNSDQLQEPREVLEELETSPLMTWAGA